MTNKTFTESRRTFLKGAAYTSVLALGGLSSIALAAKDSATTKLTGFSPSSGISIMQHNTSGVETVTLINQSNKTVMLNALKPISLENFNGSLIVKVNQVESEGLDGMTVMAPSERISFDIIDADLFPSKDLDGIHLEITSEHSGFERFVPVQTA